MIRCWIRYLILLFCVGILYIFYVGYVSWFLFVLVLSLPICSLCLFMLGMNHLDIHMSAKERYTICDTEKPMMVTKTRTIFPLAYIQATITIQNHFLQEEQTVSLPLHAQYHGNRIKLPDALDHIGVREIRLNQVRCYDLLGMFYKKKKIHGSLSYLVIPKEEPWKEMVSVAAGEEISETPGNVGIDVSDLCGVHEYRIGDPLDQMHWKLSAKKDVYMVKEYGKMALSQTSIYFEMIGSISDCEQILANVMNFSLYLLKEGHPHEIIQMQDTNIILRFSIANRKELDAFLYRILSQRFMSAHRPTTIDLMTNDHTFVIDRKGLRKDQRGDEHA